MSDGEFALCLAAVILLLVCIAGIVAPIVLAIVQVLRKKD